MQRNLSELCEDPNNANSIFYYQHYRAVLLVPDVFRHHHLKLFMDLLLSRLGFGAAFLHQESVCATFGSGIASACVVDVGDQKTSVTCVEDGISYKETRSAINDR